MSRTRRGFTIIELMIVVTIIAILASIAIPSLLRARMAANETACIGTLKAIATAQSQFRRLDHPFTGGTQGVYEYAKPFTNLFTLDSTGEVLIYIDKGVSEAHFLNGAGVPKDGYFFLDLLNVYPVSSAVAVPMDYRLRYGITAVPAEYNLTGLNSYYRDDKGVCFQLDTGLNTASDADTFHTMHDNPRDDGFLVQE